jgi:hypothetical protein
MSRFSNSYKTNNKAARFKKFTSTASGDSRDSRRNARNTARYLTKQYKNGQEDNGYEVTSRKQARSVKMSKAKKQQKEQYSVCYDDDDNDDDVVWITLRNHRHESVIRGSPEHKRICALTWEQCRRLHMDRNFQELDDSLFDLIRSGRQDYLVDAHQSNNLESLNNINHLPLHHDDDDSKPTEALEEMHSEQEVRGGGRLPRMRVGAWLKCKASNALESTRRAVTGVKWILARV